MGLAPMELKDWTHWFRPSCTAHARLMPLLLSAFELEGELMRRSSGTMLAPDHGMCGRSGPTLDSHYAAL
jgi:hypothetical protein